MAIFTHMKLLFPKKWFVAIVHIAIWVLLFSLPFILRPSYNNQPEKHNDGNAGIWYYVVNNLFWIGLFYFNSWVLIPRMLNKSRPTTYTVTLIVLFVVYILIGWANRMIITGDANFYWRAHILFTTFIYLFFIAASIAYQTTRDRMKADKLSQERENENLKTELSLLRSQVSPHFMFNVLNNMVALARKQSDLLEPSLIKLSSLMRYMLYDSDGEKVSLEKEIDYLQSYIDLQKMRFGKNVSVNISFHDIDSSYEIEPMLLIPFVENAFKHGTGMIQQARIDIELQAKNGTLDFIVRNRYSAQTEEVKDNTSGIGLANVRRRLNLLYGQRHQLQIETKDDWFLIHLHLNLPA